MRRTGLTVLKVGGELLEDRSDLAAVVAHVARGAAEGPLVVVHGGGRELTQELSRRGGQVRMVDGIRVTDEEALAAAVSVLGGTINSRLVAALVGAGVRAVGLSGVDGGVLRVHRAPPVRSRTGALVNLGHVGVPTTSADGGLLESLTGGGWVPIVAPIGITAEARLLNVNADVAASHLSIALRAKRLLILGATDGVFDAEGRRIRILSRAEARELVSSGVARDGMAAKVDACVRAAAAGVAEVRIVNGRAPDLQAGGTTIAGRLQGT